MRCGGAPRRPPGGHLFVAMPKQRFDLCTGVCLGEEAVRIPVPFPSLEPRVTERATGRTEWGNCYESTVSRLGA